MTGYPRFATIWAEFCVQTTTVLHRIVVMRCWTDPAAGGAEWGAVQGCCSSSSTLLRQTSDMPGARPDKNATLQGQCPRLERESKLP